MLNLYRRRCAHCGSKGGNGVGANCGKRTLDGHGKGYCPSKPPCWIYDKGIDGQGRGHKPQNFIDPATGRKLRDWNRACEIIRAMELPTPHEPAQRRQASLDEAIAAFRALKEKKSADVQRKTRLLLLRLNEFLGKRYAKISTLPEISRPYLIAFRNTWTDEKTTQTRNQRHSSALWKLGKADRAAGKKVVAGGAG